jgi:hypothetical protein
MLLTLLTATSSATFFASAVLTARHQHAALGGYVLAIIIGSLLAACNAYVLYKAGDVVASLTRSSSKSMQEWCGRAFFLVTLLWIPTAAFLGNWTTSAAMRSRFCMSAKHPGWLRTTADSRKHAAKA